MRKQGCTKRLLMAVFIVFFATCTFNAVFGCDCIGYQPTPCHECIGGDWIYQCVGCQTCGANGCEDSDNACSQPCEVCEGGNCVSDCENDEICQDDQCTQKCADCETYEAGICTKDCTVCQKCVEGGCENKCGVCQTCGANGCEDDCIGCQKCEGGGCVGCSANETCNDDNICVDGCGDCSRYEGGVCVKGCGPCKVCNDQGYCEARCPDCQTCMYDAEIGYYCETQCGACEKCDDDGLGGYSCQSRCGICEKCKDGDCEYACGVCEKCTADGCEPCDSACETCTNGTCIDNCSGCNHCEDGVCVAGCPPYYACIEGECESTDCPDCEILMSDGQGGFSCQSRCGPCENCRGGECKTMCGACQECVDGYCENQCSSCQKCDGGDCVSCHPQDETCVGGICVSVCTDCKTREDGVCVGGCGACGVCVDNVCRPLYCPDCTICTPPYGCTPICNSCQKCEGGICKTRCVGCTECRGGACVNSCKTCQKCVNGECEPCDSGCETCTNGICVDNCTGCTHCEDGVCVGGCRPCEKCNGIQCVENCDDCYACNDQGVCETTCGNCERCVDGECQTRCGACQECVDGECEDQCGACQKCVGGECVSCDFQYETCINDICVDNCEECQHREAGICVGGCASCQVCKDDKCINDCPVCEECTSDGQGGYSCQTQCGACEKCDGGICKDKCGNDQICKDGDCEDRCGACDRYEGGVCVSNCDECEVCEEGECVTTCTGCSRCVDGECETGCDPVCETCDDGVCIDLCEECYHCEDGVCVTNCGECEICEQGTCITECETFNCMVCKNGSCETTCGDCEECEDGICITTCVECQECVGGTCEDQCGNCSLCVGGECADKCTGACHSGCIDGICQDDDTMCNGECHKCEDGICIDDHSQCTNGCQHCEGGVCVGECPPHYGCVANACVCNDSPEYSPGSPISKPTITQSPFDDKVCPGSVHSLTCETSTDNDIYGACVSGEWQESSVPDTVTHTWDDSSGRALLTQKFVNGVNTGTTVQWIAPLDSSEEVTITVTANDTGGTGRNDPSVTDSVSGTPMCVNLIVGGINEEDEVEIGRYINFNNDDDNKNSIIDKKDGEVSPSDDDLVEITLQVYAPGAGVSGTAKLDAIAGSKKIKIWESQSKDTEVELEKTWDFTTWDLPEPPNPQYPYSKKLYVEGYEISSLKEVELQLSCELDDPEASDEDKARITVFSVDIDIDSDNDNVLEDPERDEAEDLIEDWYDSLTPKPGKYIMVNDDDNDEDGIPDFADGFNLKADTTDDNINSSEKFVPLIFDIGSLIDKDEAKFRFIYLNSDPAQTNRAGTAPDYTYTPNQAGPLRIWKKAGNVERLKEHIGDTPPGDFVKLFISYTAAQLGFEGSDEITLYIESVNTSTSLGQTRIGIQVDPDGDDGSNPWFYADAVRLTSIKVDADIDTDNNNGLSAPLRTLIEDHYEHLTEHPQGTKWPCKLIAVNDGDVDDDGVPNFADGIDKYSNSGANAGGGFTPFVVEIPTVVDLQTVKLRFVYDKESNPAGVIRSGTGTPSDPYIFTPAAGGGKFRIWNVDGNVDRKVAEVSSSGNYVKSNSDYSPDDLGFGTNHTKTLYIEGIDKSTDPADQTFKVEIDPDGTGENGGPAGWMCTDVIRLTLIDVDLDVDADRNNVINGADEVSENTWNTGVDTRGAIVLPNCDKDNTTLKAPDNWVGGTGNDWDFDPATTENPNITVDPDPDKDDLGPLYFHKIMPDCLLDNMVITLEVKQTTGEASYFSGVDAEDRLRIFLPSDVSGNDHIIKAGDISVIGVEKGDEAIFKKTPNPSANEYSYSIFEGEGIVKFGVEGIRFGFMVDVEVKVEIGGHLLGSDKVRLKVAPFVLSNHLSPVNTSGSNETVYVEDIGSDNSDLRTKLNTKYSTKLDQTTLGDRWHQDGYEIGYVKAPYGEMPVVLSLRRGLCWDPVTRKYTKKFYKYTHNVLLKSGVGVCTEVEDDSSYVTQDGGGNLECIPNSSSPGMVFHGDQMASETEDFFDAQNVNPGLAVKTDWLLVGHVDEVVSASPDGTHIIVADPEVCWALLIWADKLSGSAVMLQDMLPHSMSGTPVSYVVSDMTLRNFNFSTVMASTKLPQIRSDLGLASPESIPVADPGNSGSAALAKGGAFIGFFPNNNTREYKITFTNATDYDLEYRESGSWISDGSGEISKDEVFTDSKCFILMHWWSGTPAANDVFTFNADPSCNTLEMPVLFREVSVKALAYTNNHVNSLIDDSSVISAQSFGPSVNYTGSGASNILGDYVESIFSKAVLTLTPADDRAYHNNQGSLHCGTNVQRDIPTDKWWEY